MSPADWANMSWHARQRYLRTNPPPVPTRPASTDLDVPVTPDTPENIAQRRRIAANCYAGIPGVSTGRAKPAQTTYAQSYASRGRDGGRFVGAWHMVKLATRGRASWSA